MQEKEETILFYKSMNRITCKNHDVHFTHLQPSKVSLLPSLWQKKSPVFKVVHSPCYALQFPPGIKWICIFSKQSIHFSDACTVIGYEWNWFTCCWPSPVEGHFFRKTACNTKAKHFSLWAMYIVIFFSTIF